MTGRTLMTSLDPLARLSADDVRSPVALLCTTPAPNGSTRMPPADISSAKFAPAEPEAVSFSATLFVPVPAPVDAIVAPSAVPEEFANVFATVIAAAFDVLFVKD